MTTIYNEGDRLKITFECEVARHTSEYLSVRIIDDQGVSVFSQPEMESDAFQIERIEAPLAVGDRVTWAGCGLRRGNILAINGSMAWVRWSESSMSPPEHRLIPTANIERCG